MNDEERAQRFAMAREAEFIRGEKGLYWLSFADPEKPRGYQFLGVVILEAYGHADAINRSHAEGLNPGGEVQSMQVDPTDLPKALWNRLLKKPDLAGFGVSTVK